MASVHEEDYDFSQLLDEVAVDHSFDLRAPTKTMCAIERVFVRRAEFHLIATKNQIFYYVPCNGQFENLPLPQFQADDIEIVSMTAFNSTSKSNVPGEGLPKFAVTFGQRNLAHSPDYQWWLNIYGLVADRTLHLNVDYCQSIELGYMPFAISNSDSIVAGSPRSHILMSGGDKQVHLYVMRRGKFFEKSHIRGGFSVSEFRNMSCGALTMSIKFRETKSPTRLIAMGFQDGLVKLSFSSLEAGTSVPPTQPFQQYLDGPLTCVEIFSLAPLGVVEPLSSDRIASQLMAASGTGLNYTGETESAHLIVGSAMGECTVYEDITHFGLEKPIVLPRYHEYGSVLCLCILKMPPPPPPQNVPTPRSSAKPLSPRERSGVFSHFQSPSDVNATGSAMEKEDLCERRDILIVDENFGESSGGNTNEQVNDSDTDADRGESDLMPVVILVGTFDNFVLTYRVRQKRRATPAVTGTPAETVGESPTSGPVYPSSGAGGGGRSSMPQTPLRSPIRRVHSSPSLPHHAARQRSKSEESVVSTVSAAPVPFGGTGAEASLGIGVGLSDASATPVVLRSPEFHPSQSPSPNFGAQSVPANQRLPVEFGRSQTPQMSATSAGSGAASATKFSLGRSAISALQSQQQSQQQQQQSHSTRGMKHADSAGSLFAVPDDQSSLLSGVSRGLSRTSSQSSLASNQGSIGGGPGESASAREPSPENDLESRDLSFELVRVQALPHPVYGLAEVVSDAVASPSASRRVAAVTMFGVTVFRVPI